MVNEWAISVDVMACEAGGLSALADSPGLYTLAAKLVDTGKLLSKLADAKLRTVQRFRW